MEEEDRVENAQILNAGSDNTNSNNGESSFHINFFAGNEQECITEFCPSETGYQLESPSGLVTYTEQATETEVFTLPLELEICCKNLGFNNYFNTNDGTTPCYWCPPSDSFTEEVVVGQGTLLTIIRPNGTQATPSQNCCEIRGGLWITPPPTAGPNGELIEGKPFCKKNIAADPNEVG